MGALELISNQMPVIAGACLFLTALGLGIYRLARPSFGAMWLVASAGTIVSWLMILASRPDEPRQLISVEWQPQALFQTRISFVLDPVSWTLGLALIALLLAVILTDAARTNIGPGDSPNSESRSYPSSRRGG